MTLATLLNSKVDSDQVYVTRQCSGFQVFTQGVKCYNFRRLGFLRLYGDLSGDLAISTHQNLLLVGADNKGGAELVDVIMIIGHCRPQVLRGHCHILIGLSD